MGLELKDIDLSTAKEPEVVKAVVKEIQRLGDNTKEVHEKLNNSFKNLMDEFDNLKGSSSNEKVEKLIEDITVRQTALDKANEEKAAKLNTRLDDLEVYLQRHGKSTHEEVVKLENEIKEFHLAKKAIKQEAMSYEAFKRAEFNEQEYIAYKEAFEAYLRNPGDERNLTPDYHKALSVGVDPDGGFSVVPFMSNVIMNRLFESDPVRQLASVVSITTDAFEQLVDWGEFGYGWEGETESGDTTGTGDMKKKRIPVHIMYAKPHATQQFLEDSSVNAEQYIAMKVADKFMRGEAAAFVTGDGIGKPRGFLTYANGTDYGQIEQVNMGAAAALTADGFQDVKFALKEFYLERGAWLMNRTTVQAALKLKDGEGRYIWSPGLTVDNYATILNLPVRMSTTMPEVAANALSVALALWSEAYTVVDRLGISLQRDPYTAKPFVEFYFRKRVGGDVVNFEAIKIGKIAV